MTDLKTLSDWLSLLATIGTLGLAVLVLYLRTRFAEMESVTMLGGKVERLEDRVSKVEGEIEHLPDKDTAHRLEMAVLRLEGRIEVMDERLKPVSAIASRMQDVLIEGGPRT